jgi:hypothetical protein
MASPEVVAGQIVRENIQIDRETAGRLAGILPGDVVPPSQAVAPRRIDPDAFQRLVRAAAVVAAGLDPALTPDPPPPVLWERNGSRLLVQVAGVHGKLGDGLVDIVVPVLCDELAKRAADITTTFVTGSTDRPAGALAVTEDRPRGPALVVELWHEPLVAYAWHTFVRATSALAHVGATDSSGRLLITVGVAVTPDGIATVPMARHPSDKFGAASPAGTPKDVVR